MPLTRDQALEKARQAVLAAGWPWDEPAEAHYHSGRLAWEVFTNTHEKGARARVVLHAETGEVLEKGFIPR